VGISEVTFSQHPLGLLFEDPRFQVFFGNRNSGLEKIRQAFPKISWVRIRQTHSNLVLHSSAPQEQDLPEADAHWSNRISLGLLIATADCVPVLVFDPMKKKIAAIHAGWRGVASRIIPKTLDTIAPENADRQALQVFIGPHIQFGSFEIQKDVKGHLMGSVKNPPKTLEIPGADGKYFFDLNSLVMAQLLESGVTEHQVLNSGIDTKTDLEYHSYRRDRELAGRQLSFIAMK
jgi:hypothetical protein